MQSIGILYATREGQTRRIAEHVAAELRGRGFAVTVTNVRDHAARSRLNACTAAILAASVHAGRHEPEMLQFVKEHRGELEYLPTAFLSVTLSEAGSERSDATPEEQAQFVADVQTVLDRFFAETGWYPERVKPVAGALLYTQYNFLIRFVMKRIAKHAGGSTDTSRDHEYTDWVALDRFIAEWVEEFSASTTGTGSVPKRNCAESPGTVCQPGLVSGAES
jgi:menaquinone-dependent protoporphyrinogen oxidase